MTERKAPVDLSRFRAIAERPERASPTTGTAASAELSRFIEDPNNPRTEFDTPDFQAFLETVRARGILQPVMVVPAEEGKLRIRFGARRLRAAQQLGLERLEYVLVTDERQMDEIAQWHENESRSPLSPMDRALFVRRLVAKGMPKKEIAGALNLDPSSVTHLLSLADATGFILELYESGKCRQPSYLYRLRRLWEKDPRRVEKRCSKQENITGSFIESLQEQLQPDADDQSTTRTTRKPPGKRRSSSLPRTSAAVAARSLTYKGRRVSITAGIVVLTAEDGSEHEVAGDALAELVLVAART